MFGYYPSQLIFRDEGPSLFSDNPICIHLCPRSTLSSSFRDRIRGPTKQFPTSARSRIRSIVEDRRLSVSIAKEAIEP